VTSSQYETSATYPTAGIGIHPTKAINEDTRPLTSLHEVTNTASSRAIEPLTKSAAHLHEKIDPTQRTQLIRQRAVAKSALTRMQTFIESGDRKVNEIQVRFDGLQGIFDRYDTAQNELELFDDTDHFGDRELFENLC